MVSNRRVLLCTRPYGARTHVPGSVYTRVFAVCHLAFWYAQPLAVSCCIGTPKWGVVVDRLRALVLLVFLTGYCLIGDAANHGYFLLRIPSEHRDAVVLLLTGERVGLRLPS